MKTIRQTHGHAIVEAARVLKTIPFSKASVKLQAISAVSHSTINKVSEVFNVANTTLKFWIRTFEKSGIEGLESKVKNPKKPKLDMAQKDQVRSWIETNPNVTMKQLKFMIRKNFNIEISLVGIWKNVQKMDFSHITARSVHYKQDKEKLEEFKKNSNRNKGKKSK
jgi:transposase